MKKYMRFGELLALTLALGASALFAEDKVWIFSYNSSANDAGGLCFATSKDKTNWEFVGGENRAYFHTNIGPWGSKKMLNPFLYKASDKTWHCVYANAWDKPSFTHCTSLNPKNLVDWRRQTLLWVGRDDLRVSQPVVYSAKQGTIIAEFKGNDGKFYQTSTKDFKKFSEFKEIPESSYNKNFEKYNHKIKINGKEFLGQINEADSDILDTFKRNGDWHKTAPWHKTAEKAEDDAKRFGNAKEISIKIESDFSKRKKISSMLAGIFFEDINYAADGGLYAELIQNRGFEYDRKFKREWTPMTAWKISGEGIASEIKNENPVHKNNANYISLNVEKIGASLSNSGFGNLGEKKEIQAGISLKKGEKYDFSAFARGDVKEIEIRLADGNGKAIGSAKLNSASPNWKKIEAVIAAKKDTSSAYLQIVPLSTGKIDLDLVSLFPQKTFKNRKNGLRADIAQAIADLKPKFMRFPGGCLVHANPIQNTYRWENTIGPLESRKNLPNFWGYMQSMGLGYHEYFQFCEDINAEPVPVVSAGVSCPNPQAAYTMEEMEAYTQSILDLIEYANGDAKTSKWGRKRAENGHPKPFNLKYVGIGNEDDITDMFEERFAMIYNAIRKKHPDIKIIGTVGATFAGRDYEEGWMLAKKYKIDIMDEHYYVSPAWFLHNQNFYDKYDRSGSKVYLGEYAAHVKGRKNTMETALSCAIHLTNLERNGDIVEMASYAPLLAKKNFTAWKPDLIYFDNDKIYLTADYYVQKLFGQNAGDLYLPSSLEISENTGDAKARIASSVVIDSKTGDTILKIVNMTPCKINADVSLPHISKKKTAIQSVISGNYDDENAVPAESEISLGPKFKKNLPPYSLTVLRFKK